MIVPLDLWNNLKCYFVIESCQVKVLGTFHLLITQNIQGQWEVRCRRRKKCAKSWYAVRKHGCWLVVILAFSSNNSHRHISPFVFPNFVLLYL